MVHFCLEILRFLNYDFGGDSDAGNCVVLIIQGDDREFGRGRREINLAGPIHLLEQQRQSARSRMSNKASFEQCSVN